MSALARRYGRALLSPRGEPLVLLFSTIGKAERAARLHVASCPVARAVKRTTRKMTHPDEDDVDDLNERGFPVKTCKCVR